MKKFKMIVSDGPESLEQCLSCDHQFWISAHTEENLEFCYEDRYLKPVCPNCGENEIIKDELEYAEFMTDVTNCTD